MNNLINTYIVSYFMNACMYLYVYFYEDQFDFQTIETQWGNSDLTLGQTFKGLFDGSD